MVSETYISELIHASLDLLIDGEKGIWYLTKDGFVLETVLQVRTYPRPNF